MWTWGGIGIFSSESHLAMDGVLGSGISFSGFFETHLDEEGSLSFSRSS